MCIRDRCHPPPPRLSPTASIHLDCLAACHAAPTGAADRSLCGPWARHVTAPGQPRGHDFGPETTTAVQDFQREFGLTVDGVVGPVTWAALFAQAPGHRLPPTLQQGSTGPLVALLQEVLNQAKSLFAPAIPALSVDGNFGPLTRTTVQFLQRYGHVGDDGIVGLHTWAISLDSFGQSLWGDVAS